MIRHASLIARRLGGHWRGVLIEGPSGGGKSDLMLRALDLGWSLVADDRVLVWVSGGRLFGRAPEPLAGLIEIRGTGVVPVPALAFAEIVLRARCAPSADIDRMPEPDLEIILDQPVPSLRLAALEASAPAKLAYALTRVGLPAQPSYLARSAGWGSSGRGRGPVSSLE